MSSKGESHGRMRIESFAIQARAVRGGTASVSESAADDGAKFSDGRARRLLTGTQSRQPTQSLVGPSLQLQPGVGGVSDRILVGPTWNGQCPTWCAARESVRTTTYWLVDHLPPAEIRCFREVHHSQEGQKSGDSNSAPTNLPPLDMRHGHLICFAGAHGI